MNKKNIKKDTLVRNRLHVFCARTLGLYSCAIGAFTLLIVNGFGQTPSSKSDDKMIDQYVRSIGSGTIVFDASNIKQFWIDPSVVCTENNTIDIHLLQKQPNVFESRALKIQLANVNETLACKIQMIIESPDTSFWVSNSKSKKLSFSTNEEKFLDYHMSSLVFNLEDAPDFSFNVNFSNPKKDVISIKKIILSFAKNQTSSFVSSPGKLTITGDNITAKSGSIVPLDNHSSVVLGDRADVFSNKKIIVSDSELNLSVKIKNSDTSPATIYVGYAPYTKDGKQIHNRNNPYKNLNKIMKVVSSEKDSNSIIVDSYPEWQNGCYLALNAKEDLSDFPNFNISAGKIIDVKKINATQAEITFDKPFQNAIQEGTPVRIQSPYGSTYIYTNSKSLQPGEETEFSSTIKKDDNLLEFSPKGLCKGIYYVIPVILIRHTKNDPENKCEISDFTVTY